jgi:hypothetical protein
VCTIFASALRRPGMQQWFPPSKKKRKKISFLEIQKNGIGKINFDFIIEALEIQLEVQALKKHIFMMENPFYMALLTVQHCF